MDNAGKLKPREKLRGKKKAIQRIVENFIICYTEKKKVGKI